MESPPVAITNAGARNSAESVVTDESIRVAHFANPGAQKYFHAGRAALRFQHSRDLVGRAIAKKLAQRFFVIGDAVLFDQGDKVLRRVARQRRFREVGIRGNEILRLAIEIREITASAARNQDFLSGSFGVLQDRDAPAAFAGLDRAQQSRGACPDDQHVKRFVRRFRSHFSRFAFLLGDQHSSRSFCVTACNQG